MLRHRKRRRLAFLVIVFLVSGSASIAWSHACPAGRLPAQAAQLSPTPIDLRFPTFTPTTGPPTATPTRTPTSEGRPWVEAVSDETNVRAGPDINATILAQIFPGTRYTVLGKRFQWYQIEFPNSATGIAWVHESVVNVGGDETLIANLDEEALPTVDPVIAAGQATAEAITLTPGAAATLTAAVQITPTGLYTADPALAPEQGDGSLAGARPTFTYPPYTPTPLVIPRTSPGTATSDSGIPPIIPIMALGALGLMGLLIGILRRL